MDRIGTRQDLNRPVTIYPLRHGARLNGTEVIGRYGKGRMLHAAQRIPIGLCLFALRNFEKRTQAIVTHIKKVVTYALVGCITPVHFFLSRLPIPSWHEPAACPGHSRGNSWSISCYHL